jgi:hypothetical protein
MMYTEGISAVGVVREPRGRAWPLVQLCLDIVFRL